MSIDMLSLVFRHQFTASKRNSEDRARRYGCSADAKKLVMIAIADVANADGEHAFPGIRRIAELAQKNLDTVRIALAHLVADGYLELVEASNGRRADEYRIVIHRFTVARGSDPRANGEPEDAPPARTARVTPARQRAGHTRAQRHNVITSYASASPTAEPPRWVPAPADAKAPAPPPPEDIAHARDVLERWRRHET